MTYIIVNNHSAQAMVEEVNEWIAKGFKPQGGVTSVPIHGEAGHSLIQAMVSVDEPKVIEEPIKSPRPRDIRIIKTQREMGGIYPRLKVKYGYKNEVYGIILEDDDMDISKDSIILSCLEDVMARGV